MRVQGGAIELDYIVDPFDTPTGDWAWCTLQSSKIDILNPENESYYGWNSTLGCNNTYENLSAIDENRDVDYANVQNRYANHWYNLTINKSVSNILSIEPIWVGYNINYTDSGTESSFNFTIWNFSSSSWIEINSTNTTFDSDVTFSKVFNSSSYNLSEFIQGGQVYLGVSGGWTCFAAGTKISMADGSYKNIEDIAVGELVKSYDYQNNEVKLSEVTKVFHHSIEEMKDGYYLTIKTENHEVNVTPNHLIYANEKWTAAGELKIGDLVLNETNKFEKIISIEKVYKKIPTYNLEIEKYNVYFAGFLVHNMKVSPPDNAYLYTNYVGINVINTTLGPDSTPPSINFTSPTPSNGSSQSNTDIYVNVSTSDASDHYVFRKLR